MDRHALGAPPGTAIAPATNATPLHYVSTAISPESPHNSVQETSISCTKEVVFPQVGSEEVENRDYGGVLVGSLNSGTIAQVDADSHVGSSSLKLDERKIAAGIAPVETSPDAILPVPEDVMVVTADNLAAQPNPSPNEDDEDALGEGDEEVNPPGADIMEFVAMDDFLELLYDDLATPPQGWILPKL